MKSYKQEHSSVSDILAAKPCGNLTKTARGFEYLSRGNCAVNTCKYWQGWPQAKKATAHLYLNRFSGITNLPPHCLHTHEHALQECPLTTQILSMQLVEHRERKPGLYLNPERDHPPCTETHPSPSASLPVSPSHTSCT